MIDGNSKADGSSRSSYLRGSSELDKRSLVYVIDIARMSKSLERVLKTLNKNYIMDPDNNQGGDGDQDRR